MTKIRVQNIIFILAGLAIIYNLFAAYSGRLSFGNIIVNVITDKMFLSGIIDLSLIFVPSSWALWAIRDRK
jgi:hypothetical protein